MFKKRHPQAGSQPGTWHVAETAPPPKIRLIHYTGEAVCVEEIDDPRQLERELTADGVT